MNGTLEVMCQTFFKKNLLEHMPYNIIIKLKYMQAGFCFQYFFVKSMKFIRRVNSTFGLKVLDFWIEKKSSWSVSTSGLHWLTRRGLVVSELRGAPICRPSGNWPWPAHHSARQAQSAHGIWDAFLFAIKKKIKWLYIFNQVSDWLTIRLNHRVSYREIFKIRHHLCIFKCSTRVAKWCVMLW